MGKNSFEQLNINYVNEKLRQFTTTRLIIDEIDYYESKGLEAPEIEYLDNVEVLGNLILINVNHFQISFLY